MTSRIIWMAAALLVLGTVPLMITVLTFGHVAMAQEWVTAGERLNPTAGTILAQTPALTAGRTSFEVALTNDSASEIKVYFERLDAAGRVFLSYPLLAQPRMPGGLGWLASVETKAGERFRLRLGTRPTQPASVAGMIQWTPANVTCIPTTP